MDHTPLRTPNQSKKTVLSPIHGVLLSLSALGMTALAALSDSLLSTLLFSAAAAGHLLPCLREKGFSRVFAILVGVGGAGIGLLRTLLMGDGRFEWIPLLLLPLAFSLPVALLLEKKKSFTAAVFGGGLTAALWLLLTFVLFLFLRYGSIGGAALTTFFSQLQAELSAAFAEFYDLYRENLAQMVELGQITAAQSEQILEQVPSVALIEETVKTLLTVVRLCFAGLLLFLCELLSYVGAKLGLLIRRCKGTLSLSKEERSVTMDWIGAVLFYLVCLLTVFVSAETAVGAVALNLFLAFLPPFVLLGGKEVFSRKQLKRPFGVPVLVGLLLLTLLDPLSLPLLLSLIGASRCLSEAFVAWKQGGKGSGL